MRLFSACVFVLLLESTTGCSTDEAPAARSERDSGAPGTVASLDAAREAAQGFSSLSRGSRIFEIRQPLPGGGLPIASDNYFCTVCLTDAAAEAAFDAATPPDGFEISPKRRIVAASGTLLDPVNSRGAPVTLDLIAAIDGEESRLGAQPQSGELVDGVAALVTMESSRRLAWDAGDSLEEIFDGEHTYVLFARIDDPAATPPESIELPVGWSHRSRTLDAPFVLEAVPRVMVLVGLQVQHLWQRVQPPG